MGRVVQLLAGVTFAYAAINIYQNYHGGQLQKGTRSFSIQSSEQQVYQASHVRVYESGQNCTLPGGSVLDQKIYEKAKKELENMLYNEVEPQRMGEIRIGIGKLIEKRLSCLYMNTFFNPQEAATSKKLDPKHVPQDESVERMLDEQARHYFATANMFSCPGIKKQYTSSDQLFFHAQYGLADNYGTWATYMLAEKKGDVSELRAMWKQKRRDKIKELIDCFPAFKASGQALLKKMEEKP